MSSLTTSTGDMMRVLERMGVLEELIKKIQQGGPPMDIFEMDRRQAMVLICEEKIKFWENLLLDVLKKRIEEKIKK